MKCIRVHTELAAWYVCVSPGCPVQAAVHVEAPQRGTLHWCCSSSMDSSCTGIIGEPRPPHAHRLASCSLYIVD